MEGIGHYAEAVPAEQFRQIIPSGGFHARIGQSFRRMKNMDDVFAYENSIAVSPTLVKMFRPEAAIFLEKFHCWLQESKVVTEGKPWVEGNFDAWGVELPFLTPRTMRRIVKRFQKFGLLMATRRDGVEWYTLDYKELMKQVAAYRAKHGVASPCPTVAEGGEAL